MPALLAFFRKGESLSLLLRAQPEAFMQQPTLGRGLPLSCLDHKLPQCDPAKISANSPKRRQLCPCLEKGNTPKA